MSKSWYLLMILFFITAISGCNSGDDKISDPYRVSSSSLVRMGGIFPFTGASSDFGKPLHQAALLALKHLSEAGYQVGWLVADTKSDPEESVTAALELVEEGQVQVLIGSWASSATIAIAEQVSIPNQVLQISYGSSSTEITNLAADEDQDLLFRTVPSDTLQGAVLAQLAFDTGYKHISVLYVDNSYGRGLKEIFTENFNALVGNTGGVVAAVPHQEVVHSELEGGQSYLAELQLAKTGGTEALVAISYPQHAKIYLKEAIEGNFFTQFIFANSTKSEEIAEAVGPQHLEGMCGTIPSSRRGRTYHRFIDNYEAEYGQVSTESFLTNTYDAVIIAVLAAYAAQANGEEVTPFTIRDYLRDVNDSDGQVVKGKTEHLRRAKKMLDSGLTINYEGISGHLDFDEYGDVGVTPVEIWCYQDGQFEYDKSCKFDDDDDNETVNCKFEHSD